MNESRLQVPNIAILEKYKKGGYPNNKKSIRYNI